MTQVPGCRIQVAGHDLRHAGQNIVFSKESGFPVWLTFQTSLRAHRVLLIDVVLDFAMRHLRLLTGPSSDDLLLTAAEQDDMAVHTS